MSYEIVLHLPKNVDKLIGYWTATHIRVMQ